MKEDHTQSILNFLQVLNVKIVAFHIKCLLLQHKTMTHHLLSLAQKKIRSIGIRIKVDPLKSLTFR